ncbi:MAG: quinone reductase [Bacteroidetes bacterium]|nr:quinone reductase [Bacteroidota bacterium]
MKAIQYTTFGKSDVLELKQVDKPLIKEDEVLVKVKATTVNPLDLKIRSGNMQKIMPVELPFIPGSDASGIVEAVGSAVTRIKIGDAVFGTTFGGAYAEYMAMKENNITFKPENISFNEAVALAVPFGTAYSVLIEKGELKAGQKVVIHGAAGAVGSVMVQIAKALGAYVIATASGAGLDLAKGFGADEVIDYKTQDFTKLVKEADFVADTVGGETQSKSFEVLKKGGKLISIVMPPSAELAQKFEVTAQFISSAPSHKKLEYGLQLFEQGKIKASVAKTLKLEDAAKAQDLVAAGGINGKVVLEVN